MVPPGLLNDQGKEEGVGPPDKREDYQLAHHCLVSKLRFLDEGEDRHELPDVDAGKEHHEDVDHFLDVALSPDAGPVDNLKLIFKQGLLGCALKQENQLRQEQDKEAYLEEPSEDDVFLSLIVALHVAPGNHHVD